MVGRLFFSGCCAASHALPDVAPGERLALLITKLRLCSVQADFTSTSPEQESFKEIKRLVLIEIADFLRKNTNVLPTPIYAEMIHMV